MKPPIKNDTADCIHDVGHRSFVGGNDEFWAKVADLQFNLLIAQGLSPADVFLDIACGSLRGGHRFIRHLEPGHYLGIDKHIELIIYGVASELGIDTYREKRPRFVVSDRFEFGRFGVRPRLALAQSLFTHLTLADIELCLERLGHFIGESECRFFATFFESAEPTPGNPPVSHSNRTFRYTRAEIENAGRKHGWSPHYIGNWKHPRGQMLMEFRR